MSFIINILRLNIGLLERLFPISRTKGLRENGLASPSFRFYIIIVKNHQGCPDRLTCQYKLNKYHLGYRLCSNGFICFTSIIIGLLYDSFYTFRSILFSNSKTASKLLQSKWFSNKTLNNKTTTIA